MKILLVSDSHGHNEILKNLVRQYPNMNFYFHAGDSQSSPYEIAPFISVKGNCDYNDFPKERDCLLEGFKIHLEHGNALNFAINPEHYIKEKDCDIFLFGHTHQKYVNKIGKTYVFNPGSIARPRDGEKGSYLILYLTRDQHIKYEFKTLFI